MRRKFKGVHQKFYEMTESNSNSPTCASHCIYTHTCTHRPVALARLPLIKLCFILDLLYTPERESKPLKSELEQYKFGNKHNRLGTISVMYDNTAVKGRRDVGKEPVRSTNVKRKR